MRRTLFPLLAAIAVGCGGNTPVGPPPPVDKVELTAVTVPDLEAAVASHKGRVVVIDVWFLG